MLRGVVLIVQAILLVKAFLLVHVFIKMRAVRQPALVLPGFQYILGKAGAVVEHHDLPVGSFDKADAAGRAAIGMGAYTASKSGVQRLTEALAEELKDRNVTVNAVLPGTIDTPRNRLDMPDADFDRWIPPDKIAQVIVFLASEQAGAITGASIPVFGRG